MIYLPDHLVLFSTPGQKAVRFRSIARLRSLERQSVMVSWTDSMQVINSSSYPTFFSTSRMSIWFAHPRWGICNKDATVRFKLQLSAVWHKIQFFLLIGYMSSNIERIWLACASASNLVASYPQLQNKSWTWGCKKVEVSQHGFLHQNLFACMMQRDECNEYLKLTIHHVE